MTYIILGQLMFWCGYGISQCFFQDFIDCRVTLFFSDCGLIIRGPTAARASNYQGQSWVQYSIRIHLIGLLIYRTPCKRPQTVPACCDSRKTVLYIGQLRILNLMLFFRSRDHTIVAAKNSSQLDLEIRNKHSQLWRRAARDHGHACILCASLFKKEA